MTSYYKFINDFEGIEPPADIMPADVKRLISHSKHTFQKRYYFFSTSEKKFYRYFDDDKSVKELEGRIRNKNEKSLTYRLAPDISYGNKYRIRDYIIISKPFMKRIEQMNKLILPATKGSNKG